MMIRKIQYAPMKPGRQPCTMVKKDFMFSPGDLGKVNQMRSPLHPKIRIFDLKYFKQKLKKQSKSETSSIQIFLFDDSK